MKTRVLQSFVVVMSLATSVICPAQNKLTRNQILNAVRTHQENADSILVSVGDSIMCDSLTTRITLEVVNDSTARNHSYKFIFTKDDIEIDVYDGKSFLYRSTYEYDNSSYEKLKELINTRNLKKVDSYDDTIVGENNILRLYRGNKVYMSVENYNGRTNVTEGFHELVTEIKQLAPDISSAISMCRDYEVTADTIHADTLIVSLALSEESVKFKAKGGEFKKIKVISDVDDWEVLNCPEWLTYSRNKNNELILESSKNESKSERKGVVEVGCLGVIKEIIVMQL